MIVLEAVNPGWLMEGEEAVHDQCAHGQVRFIVNGVSFVEVVDDDDYTLSAAGLFLLRTIEQNHNSDHSVTDGEYLFPHCGHAVFTDDNSEYGVVIMGCDLGVDVHVTHVGDNVLLRSESGDEQTVPSSEWAVAVKQFVGQVQRLYDSQPRAPIDDETDITGWDTFWKEWNARYQAL